jgi:hypothetical protein
MRTSIMTGLLALSMSALPGFAQQAPVGGKVTASEPGKVAIAEAVKVSAVVTAIDKATRTVTLKGPEGRTFDLVAGDEVKNFAQVKVGDELVVDYVRGLTMELRKAGGALDRKDTAAAARAKPGEKPGAAVGRRVTLTAEVVDVNPGNKTITLKGPKGNVVELDVKNPDHFKVVKKGDQVEVDYVEALAITMAPAPKKGATK